MNTQFKLSLLAVLLLPFGTAHAQEGVSPMQPGATTGSHTGALPPPGLYFGYDVDYEWGKLRNGSGDKAGIDLETGNTSMVASLIWSTPYKVLGGNYAIPILAKRLKLSSASLFAISGTTWFLVPTGFYLAPDLWLLWDVMGGIGCGGAYVAVFTAILALADTLNENRRISSVVQCSGYIIVSFAPLVVGGLYEFSDTWLPSFTLMGAATAVFMGSGIAADLLFRKR